jgi:hypothetical protein
MITPPETNRLEPIYRKQVALPDETPPDAEKHQIIPDFLNHVVVLPDDELEQ